MITTKKFSLSKQTYFGILVKTYFRSRWWFPVLFWVFAILFAMDGINTIDLFLVLYAVIFPFILLLTFRRQAYSAQNKLFLMERYFEFDTEKSTGYLTDGTAQVIMNSNFFKVFTTESYYLLYLARNQFVYIPVSAFNNEEDKKWFEAEIIARIRKSK